MTAQTAAPVELLRFITAGSVDDGKSTLIGRLLLDASALMEDQIDAIRSVGGDEELNLANLTDGLRAEREQGITIDVAYRYFATPRRKFIIADTPGHVQYTRNMVTGASTANLAVILVDARRGITEQTRRHAFLASFVGIPHIVVCINKLDMVGYSQDVFESLRAEFLDFASRLNVPDIAVIPVSALKGDNVVESSTRMPWYKGYPLLRYLEDVHIANDRNLSLPRFPVQWVVRPRSDEFHDYRGYAGRVASGVFKKGDKVIALPSQKISKIKRIDVQNQPLDFACAQMSVIISLEDSIDLSRGDVLVGEHGHPSMSDMLVADVCWMTEDKLAPGRRYLLQHGSRTVKMVLRRIESRVNISTLENETEIEELGLNEIGTVHLDTSVPLVFDPYQINRATGSFIIIDEATNATVGAGLLREPEPRLLRDEGAEYVI